MAGRSLGVLSADLVLKNAGFTSGMRNSGRQTKSTMQQMRRDVDVAAKAMAGAFVVVTGAVAAMAVSAMRSTDDLAKQARALRVSEEALASYHLAANLAGIGTSTLDSALDRMYRRTAKAAGGIGPAVKALEELNIEARTFAGLNAEEQFQILSEAISGLEDPLKRLRVAEGIFGTDAARLMDFLDGGAKAADHLRERMVRANAVLGAVPTAQIEAANDAITVAQELSKGLANSIAEHAAPFVEHLANLWADASEETGGFQDAVHDMVPVVVASVAIVADAVEALRRIVVATGLAIGGMAAKATGTIDRAGGWKTVGQALLGNTAAQARLGRAAASGPDLDVGGDISDLFAADLPGQGIIDNAMQVFADSRKAAEDVVRERRKMNGPILLPDDELDDLAASCNQAVETANDAFGQQSEFAKQAARNMQTSFANFLFDPFEDGLKGMVRGFVDSLRRMVAEVASQRILSSLFGRFAGSSGILGALADIPGRASGGPVSAGMPYLVGERGPEYIVPNRASYVVPNHALGGTTVNVGGIHISGDTDVSKTQELAAEVERRLERILNARDRGLARG